MISEFKHNEIDITQWEPQTDDKFLVSFKNMGTFWKGELYKTYGLYYTTIIKEEDIKKILNLGWYLKQS